jgi:hypothetical protein
VVPGNSAGEIQLHSIRRSILVSAQQTRLSRLQKALDDVDFVRIQTVTVEGASAATRASTSLFRAFWSCVLSPKQISSLPRGWFV